MTVALVFLAAIALAGFVALVIKGAAVMRQRTAENLQKLGGKVGLELKPSVGPRKSPGLAGTLRGKPVEIFSYSTSTGKSSTPWVAITIQLTVPNGLTFKLQKQGFGTKVMEFFGVHEVTVGDPVFDRAWFVRTNRPDFLRAALIPELREKLMVVQRSSSLGTFELKGGLVKYAETGTFANAPRMEQLVPLVDLLGDLADVAEVAGP
jgi:hypothetical protein